MNDNKTIPPLLAQKLLKFFIREDLAEEVLGDLEEKFYETARNKSSFRAKLNFWYQVINYLRPFAIKHSRQHSTMINLDIYRNYFKTAIRNLARHRTYSIINLSCLTLGLASSMIIFQYVTKEKEADSFHSNSENIYRVAYDLNIHGQHDQTFSRFLYGAGEAFEEEIPEVENFVRVESHFFQEGPTMTRKKSDEVIAFKDIRSVIVDTTFLSVFSFPMLEGEPSTALKQPQAILLTQNMAKKMFGYEDAIGQLVHYAAPDITLQDFVVTGILENTPPNSHIQFDVVIPKQNFIKNKSSDQLANMAWSDEKYTAFVSLRPDADLIKTEGLMTDLVDRYIGQYIEPRGLQLEAKLQPIESIYFDRNTDLGFTGFGSMRLVTKTGNRQIIYFLSVIGFITLAIAFVSYINLSTIRSLDRAKEVGVRKVIGASKVNLKWQFFFESTITNCTALLLAIGLVIFLTPALEDFVQIEFGSSSWLSTPFLISFGGIFISGAVLSGAYPAFVLSSFKPISALKGNVSDTVGRFNTRRVLVVLQYAPAIILLVCSSVVYQQLFFMQNKDIGLEMDRLITIRSPRILPKGVTNSEAEAKLKNEILALPSVAKACYSGNQVGRGLNFPLSFKTDSAGQVGEFEVVGTGVDHDFADVYGLKLMAGEPFRKGMKHNSGGHSQINRVLVNETAVREWGFKNNLDAVGKTVTTVNNKNYQIHGVLEDFNWSSVHKSTEPVVFWYTSTNRFITVGLNSPDFQHALQDLQSIYESLFPEDAFHYEFADEVFGMQYQEDQRFARMFVLFSFVSILIAALGLFGLSAFAVARRGKEVGIRKVLGASTGQLFGLLSSEFLILALIAFALACPIAWVTMKIWLQSFAFRIDLTVIPFLGAGLGALIIALLSVSWTTFKTSVMNPVHTLKDE